MKLSRIARLIKPSDEPNSQNYDYEVLGINRDKTFMPTVASLHGVDLTKYKIVRKGTFVFSGMQTGRDMCIRIALYNNDTPCLISPAYTTFSIKESEDIIPEYLFIYFNREESDRYGAFLSDSSIRANLDWERFLNIEIPHPTIFEQQKIVNTWKALREVKEQNEAIAAPLMQMCQSYIQELKHEYEPEEIEQYIEESEEKNEKSLYDLTRVRGLATSKEIITTKANMNGVSLSSYKIVKPEQIAFVPDTSRRGDKMSLGYNETQDDYLVSSISSVINVKRRDKIIPCFLYLWFCRPEFDRYARFNSWGSARETFSYAEMERVKIPLPPIEKQQAIVNIYNCAREAQKIAEEADRMSREICPALIQHVIHNSN